MTNWPPTMLVRHASLPWELDATGMGLEPAQLDDLPWATAFNEMKELEAGAIANAAEQRTVGHYWLRAPAMAPSLAQAEAIGAVHTQVAEFVDSIHRGTLTTPDGEHFTHVLHVGIGGSQLGPQLLIDALATDTDGVRQGLSIHFLDNTDPDGIAVTLGQLGEDLARALVLVATKSGGTPEPRNALALVRRRMVSMGIDAPRHLVAITGPGSALHQTATREEWLATFPVWKWVGGRFSGTSAVGMLPAALAGIDVQALLSGAADMDAWTRTTQWSDNPAALLAGAWYLAGEGVGSRAMATLPYADRLMTLARYLQQLVMESVGKRLDRQGRTVHQGLTVYGNKGSTDQHAYVQQLRDGRDDFFVLFLQVLCTSPHDPDLQDGVGAGDYLQGFLLGTRRALHETDRLSMTLTVPEVTPYVLGGLIALFERAVGLYASLIDLNAYDQPGVEAGKKAARDILDLSRAIRARLRQGPATTSQLAHDLQAQPMEVYYLVRRLLQTGRVTTSGDPLNGPFSLT